MIVNNFYIFSIDMIYNYICNYIIYYINLDFSTNIKYNNNLRDNYYYIYKFYIKSKVLLSNLIHYLIN